MTETVLTADLPPDMQDILMSFFAEFEMDVPEKLPVRRIAIESFPEFNLADGCSDQRGENYARQMIGKTTPPIVVHGCTWLDGRHRVWAAIQAGTKDIAAIEIQGAVPVEALEMIEPIGNIVECFINKQVQQQVERLRG